MLGTMYRWNVAAFNSGLWNIPTPADQVLNSCIVQMHVKIDALCGQQWQARPHPWNKSGYLLDLLLSPRTIGNRLLQQDSDYIYVRSDFHFLHDTASTATLVS